MVIAITAGVLLACILFVNEMAAMTRITDISDDRKLIDVSAARSLGRTENQWPSLFRRRGPGIR